MKCERISNETSCWLYISGQHINGRSGFFNYVSPRLCREAKKEEVTEIQNTFNLLYATLLGARRSDAVELSHQAEKYKAELKEAQDMIAMQNAQIAQLQSELLRS